jgi:hypothetical protein
MNFPEIFLGSLSIKNQTDRGSSAYIYHLNECTIYVKNLSYNKRVGIRLLDGSAWRDFLTIYESSLMTTGGHIIEVWKLYLNIDPSDHYWLNTQSDNTKPPLRFRFAAFYNNLDWNTSYWDNNNSYDYYA